ncbi:MAG: hypothetical protein KAS32_00580 [Candidatus Peribacteraceae bacterium]|nr:hypothetical protein [Candidatus Peribacteraceae bacterium]
MPHLLVDEFEFGLKNIWVPIPTKAELKEEFGRAKHFYTKDINEKFVLYIFNTDKYKPYLLPVSQEIASEIFRINAKPNDTERLAATITLIKNLEAAINDDN